MAFDCVARRCESVCPAFGTWPAAIQFISAAAAVLGLVFLGGPLVLLSLALLLCILGGICNFTCDCAGTGGPNCSGCSCSGCSCGGGESQPESSDGGGGCCGDSGGGGCCGDSGGGSGGGTSCCDSGDSGSGSCCGDSGGGSGGCSCAAPAAAVLVPAVPWTSRTRLEGLLAHHPSGPQYEADVFRIRGVRVCVGCLITYPTFFLVAAALFLAPPILPWTWMFVAGLALASAQGVSAMGWTRWRWLKVLVKACLGVGLALAVAGTRASPWPEWVQSIVLYALLGLSLASAVPRALRLRRERRLAAAAS